MPFYFYLFPFLKIRAARKFQERQTHAAHNYLIGADRDRRQEARATTRGNQVVLIDTIAANANRADQHAVLIKRHAAGKDLNSVRQIRNRSARRSPAAENCLQVCLDQIDLQPDVEDAPFVQFATEWTSGRVVEREAGEVGADTAAQVGGAAEKGGVNEAERREGRISDVDR